MSASISSGGPAVSDSPRRSPWRALIVWVLAVSFVSAVVAVPYAVVNSLRLERTTARLRDVVTGAFAGKSDGWSRRVEVHLGGCTLGLARWVIGFTDAPEEARHALRAARSASVGVYQWHGADIEAMRRQMADASISIRVAGPEWTRVVSVRTGDESVVVLTPAGVEVEADTLELCVVVLTDGELVVVSVEVDPQPLSELVQPHLREMRREVHDAV